MPQQGNFRRSAERGLNGQTAFIPHAAFIRRTRIFMKFL